MIDFDEIIDDLTIVINAEMDELNKRLLEDVLARIKEGKEE